MKEKVHFYSKDDLSIDSNLELAEERIAKYKDLDVQITINDAIELYHITKLFNTDYRLKKWSEEYYTELKNQTKSFSTKITNCLKLINQNNAVSEYKKIDWDYQQTFWEIISNFNLYHIIDSEVIESIVRLGDNNLIIILHVNGIVERFSSIIRKLLLDEKNSAHYILDKYVSKRDETFDKEIYLPACLTPEDKEEIINKYIDSTEPNLNYIRLITQTKNTQHFRLSPKTRLKAERLEKELNDELLADNRTSIIRTQEGFALVDKKDAPPLDIEYDDHNYPTFKYSIPYIQSCNNTQVMANFISLFGWLNTNGLLNLINKRTEVDPIEYAFMDIGRNSYPTFSSFRQKNQRLFYQMYIYSKALESNQKTIESEIKDFYEIELRKRYDYPSLSINIPSSTNSWLNKCRILFPELDSIVKQYNSFVEEDEIDPDLIKMKEPLKVTSGKSLLSNKYYEINGVKSEIWRPLNLLFSNQALLAYVEPHNNKHYSTLIERLEHESIDYDKYKVYQKHEIDYLISLGLLKIESLGNIVIADLPQINVMKSLWEFGICSYWHYNKEERCILDKMFDKGWLKKDDNLLSKPERDYFSYFLDNSEFSNGHALRNRYAHGATSPDSDEITHMKAYYVFLRLLVILVLKIYDDLWLAQKALKTYILGDNSWRIIKLYE